MKRVLHVLALFAGIALLVGGIALPASATVNPAPKVWVCKYVGTPGVDEHLKLGKQPITVSSNAAKGTWFNDGQGQSYVLDTQTQANTGPGNTYSGDLTCPSPIGPPLVTPPTCTSDGSMTIPVVEGLTYTVTQNDEIVTAPFGPGTYTVSITGTVHGVEVDTSFDVTVLPKLTGEQCLIQVTPTPPTVTAPTCDSNGTLVIPTVEGVIYRVKPTYDGPGKYTIVAIPDKGYVFPPAEHDWSWDLTVLPQLTGEQCTPTPPVVTPGPPNPQASIATVCGHATFTLSNLTPQTTDESATFVTTINGKDSTQVTVKAGDTQTLGYAPTPDTGTYTIGVKSNGVVLTTATLESKCGQGGGTTKPPTTPPATEPVSNPETLPHTGGGNAVPIALAGAALFLLGVPLMWFGYRRGKHMG